MELEEIKEKALRGEGVSREEADWLAEYKDLDKLCDAANEVSRRWQGNDVDSCSIFFLLGKYASPRYGILLLSTSVLFMATDAELKTSDKFSIIILLPIIFVG